MRNWRRVAAFVVVLALLAGCAGPMSRQGAMAGAALGAVGGYAATGQGTGAAGGAVVGGILGWAIGSVMDLVRGRAGVTDCERRERWSNGKLVIDEQNCVSTMSRSGFRGDPMPPNAPVPAVRYAPREVTINPYPRAQAYEGTPKLQE